MLDVRPQAPDGTHYRGLRDLLNHKYYPADNNCLRRIRITGYYAQERADIALTYRYTAEEYVCTVTGKRRSPNPTSADVANTAIPYLLGIIEQALLFGGDWTSHVHPKNWHQHAFDYWDLDRHTKDTFSTSRAPHWCCKNPHNDRHPLNADDDHHRQFRAGFASAAYQFIQRLPPILENATLDAYFDNPTEERHPRRRCITLERKDATADILQLLTPRQQHIYHLRWDPTGPQHTRAEAAKRLRISMNRLGPMERTICERFRKERYRHALD